MKKTNRRLVTNSRHNLLNRSLPRATDVFSSIYGLILTLRSRFAKKMSLKKEKRCY